MLGLKEEVTRLEDANTTFDFNTNLLDPIGESGLTKAEAIAFITGPGFAYRDWYANKNVSADGIEDSPDRMNKVNQLVLAEPFL